MDFLIILNERDLRHSTYKEAKCQYKWMMREICDQCKCYLSYIDDILDPFIAIPGTINWSEIPVSIIVFNNKILNLMYFFKTSKLTGRCPTVSYALAPACPELAHFGLWSGVHFSFIT